VSDPATKMIEDNAQLFATVQKLVEAWCDRRCLRAARNHGGRTHRPGRLHPSCRPGCASRVMVKYRDAKTDVKVQLEDLLR